MNQSIINPATDMELSQKQLNQLNSILTHNVENEHEYSEDECSSDEEDPTPKWNIPNWHGFKKCYGCVTRIMNDGEPRGCIECDEYWNMPELEQQNNVQCAGCVTRISTYGTTRGCEECDENWDIPNLENNSDSVYTDSVYADSVYADDMQDFYDKADDPYLAERIYMQRELNGELDEDQDHFINNDVYCEGCELLKSGLGGGENQMSHACMGY